VRRDVPFRRPIAVLAAAGGLLVAGCATLQEIASLRQVDFSIGGTSDGRLAGVPLDRVRSYQDLRVTDLAVVFAALRERRLPLAFTLHVDARNPQANQVAARLLRLDWTLWLDERETVRGRLDREFVLPPGRSVDVPLDVELDLARFFEDEARDLVDLAAAVAGRGGSARIKLTARPTISTPLGDLTYPNDITIVSRDLGSASR
jgi:hypothetical protein